MCHFNKEVADGHQGSQPKPGTELTAKYKGVTYNCRVEDGDEGLVFVLEDGRRLTSPSSAGSAVMSGKAVNGWRFWSVVGDVPEPAETDTGAKASNKKVIYRLPNQKGVGERKARWFCNGCMNSFLAEADERPETCPEGHGPSVA
jgi:hypothetical protein